MKRTNGRSQDGGGIGRGDHQETLALAGLREVFPPNWEEKLNKAHRLRAKGNSQQKSAPDARTCHQQEGAERRGAGGIP